MRAREADRKRERERKLRRERERDTHREKHFHQLPDSLNACSVRPSLVQSLEPGTHSKSPIWVAGTQLLGSDLVGSRSQKLELKTRFGFSGVGHRCLNC